MSIFDKPFEEIDKDDVDQLIEEEYSEDLHLEYKMKLSKNTWQSNQQGIADSSKQSLAEEVIAFANADGGILLVGIKESGGNPPKADSIFPIPKVEDLADRIRRSIYDLTEPKIPNFRTRGIIIDGDSGVLLLKVEKSYKAPHRATFNKECYMRRNDEKIPMTMREIKDLTFKSSRVLEDVQNRMVKRAESFRSKFNTGKIPFSHDVDSSDKIGLRITILPVSHQIVFPNIYRKISTYDIEERLKIKIDDKNKSITAPIGVQSKRPILRGILLHGNQLNVEVKEDGLIEYSLVLDHTYENRQFLHGQWLISYFYNSLLLLEKVKGYYSYFGNEFIVEIEVITNQDHFTIVPLGVSKPWYGTPIIRKKNVVFPQYSYQNNQEIGGLLNLFNNDIANVSGNDININFEVLSSTG